jgi:hypothetical protein
MTLALDYPLGWPVAPATLVRRIRALNSGATPLVRFGDQVRPEQPVAEYALANAGRRAVLAGLGGRVVAASAGQHVIIEGVATVVHGIVGLGGTAAGTLVVLPRGEAPAVVPIVPGSVIIFPHQLSLTLLQRATVGGAAGIIAASAAARELEAFARTDLTALLDGQAPFAPRSPLTIVLTEGLGSASMNTATYHLLSQRIHSVVLLDGATDPRHGVRPEVMLAAPAGTAPQPVPADCAIAPGAFVSISAGTRRGSRGEVLHIFASQQVSLAGLRVPVASVRLEDGFVAIVPQHVLDRIG